MPDPATRSVTVRETSTSLANKTPSRRRRARRGAVMCGKSIAPGGPATRRPQPLPG
jgi:hypothetical protein